MADSSVLSRTQTRRQSAVNSDLEEISRISKALNIGTFTTLLKRSGISIVPDGYKTSSRLGLNRGGGESSPTEAAVLAREKMVHDELGSTVRLIEYAISEAVHFLSVAEDAMSYTVSVETEFAQRPTASAPCLICTEKPVVKSGYCLDCLKEYEMYGRPDRAVWQLWKHQTTNKEGLVLVEECPPPGPHCRASKGPFAYRASEQEDA